MKNSGIEETTKNMLDECVRRQEKLDQHFNAIEKVSNNSELEDAFIKTFEGHKELEQEIKIKEQKMISDYKKYLEVYGNDEAVRLKYWENMGNVIGKEDAMKEVDPIIAKKYIERKEIEQKNHEKECHKKMDETDERYKQIERLKKEKEELLKSKGIFEKIFGSKKIDKKISDLDEQISDLNDQNFEDIARRMGL
jgi:hypothetical protein